MCCIFLAFLQYHLRQTQDHRRVAVPRMTHDRVYGDSNDSACTLRGVEGARMVCKMFGSQKLTRQRCFSDASISEHHNAYDRRHPALLYIVVWNDRRRRFSVVAPARQPGTGSSLFSTRSTSVSYPTEVTSLSIVVRQKFGLFITEVFLVVFSNSFIIICRIAVIFRVVNYWSVLDSRWRICR